MDPIFELKKQRFQFLEKLYEESKGDPDRYIPSFMIANMIWPGRDGFEPSYKDELMGIVTYLRSERLINTRGDGGVLTEISITHEGIKELEKSRDNPQAFTKHFPPYQQITLNYNIAGNYSETGRVMGDEFREIQNTTIINKSLVENSFNKLRREHDEGTSKAIVEVDEFIEKSKNLAAAALFDSFNQELNKPQPDKSRLKSIWEGVQNALPSIATISGSVAKIVSLFA